MKKRIGIFIDHDIMIRNFIKTNVFDNLESKYNLIYFFPSNFKKRVSTNLDTLGIKNKVLNTQIAKSYGWKPKFSFEKAIYLTYQDLIKNYKLIRK